MFTRRKTLQALGAGGLAASLGLPLASRAQGVAVETLKIIVGFPPGGTTDAFGRALAEKLRGSYATNALVENKPGAGGQLGVMTLRDSPADGSTMLLTPGSMLTIYPYTYTKLAYKVDDVMPISTALYTAHGFGVGPMVPASVKNLKDFVEWAKANPTQANCGNPGAGSMPHMVAVLLEKAAGLPMKHINFPGSGPGIRDVLGGQLAAFSSPLGDYLPHIAAGRLRLLAVTGPSRSRFAPDTPTYAEQGFSELTMREWFGVFMPGRTAPALALRANAALRTALATKELIDFGAPLGLEAVSSPSPDDFARVLRADSALWGPFAKKVGFTADS